MYNFLDTPVQHEPNEEQELNAGYKLNDRQEQFCHEYMVDGNGAAAATRCGYKPYGAAHTAYRLLKTTAIKKRLAELKKENREQSPVSFGFIANKLLQLANEALEGDPVLVYDYSEKTWKDTGRRKPDRSTALKAFALLGKHIGMFDKEYAQAVEKKEEQSIEEEGKTTQLVDQYLHASIGLREAKNEIEYLQSAIAEAGIVVKPYEPQPIISSSGNPQQASVYHGPYEPLNPSEYDDQPHYEYKHIRPYKNHPERQLATPLQVKEAIRKYYDQIALRKQQDTGNSLRDG